MQDFGEKQTYYLDEWVFKELNKLFKYRTLDKCGALCVRGNIFFLNLLGLDTAGHSFKPNSEYLLVLFILRHTTCVNFFTANTHSI